MRKLFCFVVLLFPLIAHCATEIKDEGVHQGYVNILDCKGAGVSCTASGITGDITVAGGGGSGDVLGPATNHDGYIPLWNGADSKTLADGIANNSSNWNTAYGWGDHSLEGYLTAESDPLSATKALDNLASVKINTSLISDTAATDDLGTEALYWRKAYLGSDISFEGATDDAYQTTLTAVDTTLSDKSISIPDASGTMAVSATAPVTLSVLGDIGLTVAKDIVTTAPLAGGTDNILPGADSDVTLSIADAAADGSTKGAATFTAIDFTASSGVISLSRTATLAGNPVLGANGVEFASTGIIFEGATNDNVETLITVTDPTSTDKTITFPNLTGNVALSTNDLSVFSATTSAQLYGVLSDETGSASGAPLAVFNQAPTLVSPKIDHIEEDTAGHGVVIDSVQLKDGGALAIVGGTNTFDITNGTASLNIAASSTLDVNANLTVESASAVNQDLTSDASPTFNQGNFTTVHTTTLLSDHVGEHTGAHGVVFDNDLSRVGKLSIDHIAEATGAHTIVFDNSVTLGTVVGAVDVGGATSLEIPNGTSGTTDATGEVYIDTNGDGGTNFNGAVAQVYTGAANKYLFLVDLPLAASQDNYVLKYDATGKTVQWEQDADSGGSTAWDDIGNPDADKTLTMAGYETTFTSTLNEAAHSVMTITDTTADLTAAVALLKLKYTDDGDADGTFLECLDNSGGDSKFKIAANGETTVGAGTVVHGAVFSKSFVITNPTASADSSLWRVPAAVTITAVHLLCRGNVVVGHLTEQDANGGSDAGVDGATDISGTVDTNVDDDGTLSNPSIDSGDYIGWRTTSVTGTPTKAIVTFDGYWN